MSESNPLVSVVIATYNMGRYLPEAVESARSQTYAPVEIIIVDDGSTDETPDIVKRWEGDTRVRFVQQANQGQQKAKNRGITEAGGDYIAFLDADDRWKSTKLERQMPLFRGSETVGVVYSASVFIDEAGRETGCRNIAYPQGWVTEALLEDNFVGFGSAVVARKALDRFGVFDDALSMSIDYDLWLRISTEFEFRCVDEPLLEYRIWAGQMSHRMVQRTECLMRILDKFEREHGGAATPAVMARARASTLATRAYARMAAGEGRLVALREMLRAIRRDIRYRPAWKGVVKIALGRSG